MDGDESAGVRGAEEETPRRNHRGNLAAFVLFSILEETVIGAAALLVIMLLVPQFLAPGALCVAIGLGAFTAIKVHYFVSSAAIPVEEDTVGQVVRVRQDFRMTSAGVWTGRIQVRGESWTAVADEPVSKAMLVRIMGVDGLRLRVVRVSPDD